MMYTCVLRCLWELEEGIRFPEATAEGWKTKVGSRNRTHSVGLCLTLCTH